MTNAVYTPTTFRPDDLPREEQQFADGIAYFLHAAMMGRVRDSRYRKGLRRGFVPLKATFMRKILGRHTWGPVRLLATAYSLIECDEKFRPGSHSKGYRVLPPHDSAPWERRELEDAGLARRLTNWRRERRRAIWEAIRAGKASVAPEVCDFLFEQLQRVELLGGAPVDQFTPEVAIAADMIQRGDWFQIPDDYGRLHTNLTNLKKELRPFLRVDGALLKNVDIANSQPLFVGMLAKSREEEGTHEREERGGGRRRGLYVGQTDMSEVAIENDLQNYVNLCEKAQLYQFVFDRLPGIQERLATMSPSDRERLFKQTKDQVLATLYDVDSHRNKVYRILNRHFPTLMAFARRGKRGDHKRFAHLAQRTESQFMFGQVIPRLMRERPEMFVGTIHDSVLTPASEAEYVRDVMMTEFGRLGVTPTVRIE